MADFRDAFEEELVSVPVIREDLRQPLLAAQLYNDERHDRGGRRNEPLDRAIHRVGAAASGPEWQPKPREPD